MNTVTLSLEDYNELKAKADAFIRMNHCAAIVTNWDGELLKVLQPNELASEFVRVQQDLSAKIQEQEDKRQELYDKCIGLENRIRQLNRKPFWQKLF